MSENHGGNGDEPQKLTEEQEQQFDQKYQEEIGQIAEKEGVSQEEAQKIYSKRLFGQKQHFQNKSIDPETGKPWKQIAEEARKAKEQPGAEDPPKPNKEPKGEQESDADKRIAKLELSEEKRAFGSKHGLSVEAQDFIFDFAKAKGITPDEAYENKHVKQMLSIMVKDSENGNATPNPSNRAPKVGGKSFQQMDKKEQKENYSQVVKDITGKG